MHTRPLASLGRATCLVSYCTLPLACFTAPGPCMHSQQPVSAVCNTVCRVECRGSRQIGARVRCSFASFSRPDATRRATRHTTSPAPPHFPRPCPRARTDALPVVVPVVPSHITSSHHLTPMRHDHDPCWGAPGWSTPRLRLPPPRRPVCVTVRICTNASLSPPATWAVCRNHPQRKTRNCEAIIWQYAEMGAGDEFMRQCGKLPGTPGSPNSPEGERGGR